MSVCSTNVAPTGRGSFSGTYCVSTWRQRLNSGGQLVPLPARWDEAIGAWRRCASCRQTARRESQEQQLPIHQSIAGCGAAKATSVRAGAPPDSRPDRRTSGRYGASSIPSFSDSCRTGQIDLSERSQRPLTRLVVLPKGVRRASTTPSAVLWWNLRRLPPLVEAGIEEKFGLLVQDQTRLISSLDNCALKKV